MAGSESEKTVVVIPTYDELENVERMAAAVLATPDVELLFVDDNSPDGTGAKIDEMAKSEPRVSCLHRERKEGLGRAYVAGFAKALSMGAGKVVQMDCDFSHDPKDLVRLLAEDADLVIGSRCFAASIAVIVTVCSKTPSTVSSTSSVTPTTFTV